MIYSMAALRLNASTSAVSCSVDEFPTERTSMPSVLLPIDSSVSQSRTPMGKGERKVGVSIEQSHMNNNTQAPSFVAHTPGRHTHATKETGNCLKQVRTGMLLDPTLNNLRNEFECRCILFHAIMAQSHIVRQGGLVAQGVESFSELEPRLFKLVLLHIHKTHRSTRK